MQGITSARSTGAVLGFGTLAGCFALAAPAHAITVTTITHSEITSPTGPFYSVFNDDSGATNSQFTFSGTSDGDGTDSIDIRCYRGGTSYTTIAPNVPIADGGTFTSPAVDLSGIPGDVDPGYGNGCDFRAVQSGANPTDLAPFTGPWGAASRKNSSKQSGGPNDTQQYDFFADLWQRAGHVEYTSVSDCAIGQMYIMSPLSRQSSGSSWSCSAALRASDPLANAPGRSGVEVDGRQAYGSSAAHGLFIGPNSADNAGFAALTSAVAQDAAVGTATITEQQSFVACPDGPNNYPATNAGNCASFIATGIKLSRTVAQGDDGRSVLVTDSWSSTDSAAHSVKLHYNNGEQNCCGGPVWTWPGHDPSAFNSGDIVPGPFSGPDSMTGRAEAWAGPSVPYPAFALTWDVAPQRARYYGKMRFLLDYNVDVPATGAKVLRFAYANNPTQAGVEAMATRARDGFAPPTVTITSPANGATVSTSTVNVQGKALDNVGVASLVVNGTSVTPAADGTFSVPVSVVPGANALTATVKDAAGLGAEAKETVTYTPLPVPPAVKCVVPSVKKGGKVSAAKTLLTKAHCKAGKTIKKRSAKVKKGRVLGLGNKAGKQYAADKTVTIIVSSGPKKKHKK